MYKTLYLRNDIDRQESGSRFTDKEYFIDASIERFKKHTN